MPKPSCSPPSLPSWHTEALMKGSLPKKLSILACIRTSTMSFNCGCFLRNFLCLPLSRKSSTLSSTASSFMTPLNLSPVWVCLPDSLEAKDHFALVCASLLFSCFLLKIFKPNPWRPELLRLDLDLVESPAGSSSCPSRACSPHPPDCILVIDIFLTPLPKAALKLNLLVTFFIIPLSNLPTGLCPCSGPKESCSSSLWSKFSSPSKVPSRDSDCFDALLPPLLAKLSSDDPAGGIFSMLP
mmetsp:Transcript_1319/g.2403  ORF Transcript_1319/g.2403 Transcript_1319/m.2403 type:complete len:241 (-) Transcript_1319:863-1585(-)